MGKITCVVLLLQFGYPHKELVFWSSTVEQQDLVFVTLKQTHTYQTELEPPNLCVYGS